jgi:hypothetical protein
MPEVKCACGSWTELREGKWGPFFLCRSCGPISFAKGLEMFKMMKPGEAIQATAREPRRNVVNAASKPAKKSTPAHIITTSDDPRFF